jgi:8-oxo-dGTP pyrophosphatase MutT (NUDIX family)
MVDEPTRVAFTIITAPTGRCLMLRRVDDGSWSFPGGVIEPGESPEEAAVRECGEEIRQRFEIRRPILRRIKDGIDATTFLARCGWEFAPELNHEHDRYTWIDPKAALAAHEPQDAEAYAA